MNLFQNEADIRSENKIVAGVDEAGRGPLAGPVVVAAVVLESSTFIEGLNDSKKLSEKVRERLFTEITGKAIDYRVEIISPEIIDELNILGATLFGMEQAVLNMKVKPDICLIDGNHLPKGIKHFSLAMIKGDSRFASIAAASILAKVTRDRIMLELHQKHPEYNFAKNKGYPTKAHLEALNKYGIIPEHRKSYKPVQQLSFNF